MNIRATQLGISTFHQLNANWNGPYSNEMCVMQELAGNAAGKFKSLEQLRSKFDTFNSPTLPEILTRFFEKIGHIETL